MDIDLVYLWNNSYDENWKRKRDYWADKLGVLIDNCRFMDNRELKYSLRSVEMYMPWIHKIFIITDNQVPEWLDISNPKIQIINHKDILPEKVLPTYNSEAIETCIAKIPDLAEHFLFANDDCFIGKEINPNFFFTETGKPIVRLVKSEGFKVEECYTNNIQYTLNLINSKYKTTYKYEPHHNIDAYLKSALLDAENEFSTEFNKCRGNKFRKYNEIQRIVYSLYMLVKKQAVLQEVQIRDYHENMESMYISLRSENYICNLLNKKPYLFCINDDEYVINNDRNNLKDILAKRFYMPSSFEKKDYYDIKPISPKAKAIVFAPDNKYCKYFSVALQSLITCSDKNDFYDIILFGKNISDRNKIILQNMCPSNFSLRFYDIESFIIDNFSELKLKPKGKWSISMYYRIFIPFVMRLYNKVLYCDSDIVFNEKLNELYEIDFEENEILAVIDSFSALKDKDKKREEYLSNFLKLKDSNTYFNSGVLMFNNGYINLNDYKNKILQAFEISELMYPDQDILNAIFNKRTKYIHCRWNFPYGVRGLSFLNLVQNWYKKDYIEAYKKPAIIHYTGFRKPWLYPEEEYANMFWHYAKNSDYLAEIIKDNFCDRRKTELFNVYKYKIKLFNIIPCIKIRKDNNSKRIYLFNVIPLIKFTYRGAITKVKLFNCIQIFKINKYKGN